MISVRIFVFSGLILGLLGCGGGGVESSGSMCLVGTSSASVTLSWDAPIAEVDGSPLTNLEGFKIYFGTASGKYDCPIINVPGNQTSYTINGFNQGTYYFAVAAYNSAGESSYSNEVRKSFDESNMY